MPPHDVIVVGAGLGGLAAAILLARSGRTVLCIEPDRFPRQRVGESLDWSTPALLRTLGLPRDTLIGQSAGTYKRKIKVEPIGEPVFGAQPDEYRFLSERPFEFEVLTLHVDRTQMDESLFRIAERVGVRFVWDRVSHVESEGGRVVACRTHQGARFAGHWFLDASGRTQLFARALGIPRVEYGRRKICLWTYFKSPCEYAGTAFFTDGRAQYLWWIWDIPITPEMASVGYVASIEDFRRRRRPSQSLNHFLHQEFERFPRLQRLADQQPDFDVLTCSWRSYVQRRVSGPNYVMVGESAALPDPLTANGVTAAFRHATHAAELLLAAGTARTLSQRHRRGYEINIRRMGHIYNYCIERAIYEPSLRRGLSTEAALRIYAHFGYTINALFTKFEPRRPIGRFFFGVLLVGVRIWMEGWTLIGKLGTLLRRRRGLSDSGQVAPQPF